MKRLSFFMVLLFLSSIALNAQEKPQNLRFVIHEDVVKPSMAFQYEETAKQFAAILKKHNIQGADFLALSTDDFKYSFVSSIEKFADLDENPFAGLSELEGKEIMQKLWSDFDQCYDSHGDYLMTLDVGLSYMPDGIVVDDAEQLYRNFQRWYISPANMSEIIGIAKDYKALNEAKGSKVPYRVYRSGFGSDGNFIMFVSSGKDPAEFETRRQANLELLGDEAFALYQKAVKYALNVDIQTGWMRPDLSYKAETTPAEVKN